MIIPKAIQTDEFYQVDSFRHFSLWCTALKSYLHGCVVICAAWQPQSMSFLLSFSLWFFCHLCYQHRTYSWMKKTISRVDRIENIPKYTHTQWNERCLKLLLYSLLSSLSFFLHSNFVPLHSASLYTNKSLWKSTHKFVHLKFSNTQNFSFVGFSLSFRLYVCLDERVCFASIYENHNFTF